MWLFLKIKTINKDIRSKIKFWRLFLEKGFCFETAPGPYSLIFLTILVTLRSLAQF